MSITKMIREPIDERRRPGAHRGSAAGFTLLEIIVSLAVLGIIMVPLTAAFIQSIQETDRVQNAVGAAADAQRISSWWTKDVHNVEANGVTLDASCPAPLGVASSGVEQALVTFEWDTEASNVQLAPVLPRDPSDPNPPLEERVEPKKASWVIKGTGSNSELVRRYCVDDIPVQEYPVASSFWKSGFSALQLIHGASGPGQTDFCANDGRTCTIGVTGNFEYELTVERRVPGVAPPQSLVPPPPQITGAIGGNGSLTVAWLPSVVGTGVPPVDRYRVIVTAQPNGSAIGTVEVDGAALSALFEGLTNGTGYYVQAQARNANGWGPLSDPFGPVAPAPVAPGAPENVVAVRGDGQITVSWSPPSDNGGAGITTWFVRTRVNTTSEVVSVVEIAGGGVGSAVITGLENGTEVNATVSAVNPSGEGPESLASAPVRPCGVPDAPERPTVSNAGEQRTLVIYQEPPSNGCPVTQYRVYSDPPFNGPDPSPWFTTEALPNEPAPTFWTTPPLLAQSYRFYVAAINEVGEGPLSPISDAVDINAVPLVAPGLPTWEPRWRPPVSPGGPDNVGGLFTWIPLPNTPQFNGGFSITSYRVTLDPVTTGATQVFTVNGANSEVFDMGGFTQVEGTFPNEAYKEYDLSVAAVNDNGPGPAATIRVIAGGRPLASPANVTSTGLFVNGTGPGSAAVRITYDQLANTLENNGGRDITGYQAQWVKVGQTNWQTFTVGGYNPAELGGFDPGGEYLVRIAAVNASGASIPSSTLTVWAPSRFDAPAGITISRPAGTVGNRLALTFPAFTTNPGNPTPAYSAVCSAPGEPNQTFTGLSAGTNILERPQLVNGKAWSCQVTGTTTFFNGSTWSATGSTTGSAVPFTTPGAPGTPTVAAAAGGKALISWTAPATNGGNAISSYLITSSPALAGFPASVGGGTTSFETPNPLTFGTTYTFTVSALNTAGAGPSATSAGFTASSSVPGAAPTNLQWQPVHANQITFTWTPVPDTSPANGGSGLTNQTITLSPAPTSGSATVTLPIGQSSYTYTTNQLNGMGGIIEYTATVRANNVNGAGPTASTQAKAGGAPLAGVANLAALPLGSNGNVQLTWVPVNNVSPDNGGKSIDGYRITWSTGGGPEEQFYTSGANQSEAGIGGLTPGTAYTFRVRANNQAGAAGGNSAVIATIVAIAPGNPVPVGTPVLATPANPNLFGSLELTFSAWNKGPGISPPMADYSATCVSSNGGPTVTQAVSPGTTLITGMGFQRTYTCTLTGRNGPFYNGSFGSATVSNIGPATTR